MPAVCLPQGQAQGWRTTRQITQVAPETCVTPEVLTVSLSMRATPLYITINILISHSAVQCTGTVRSVGARAVGGTDTVAWSLENVKARTSRTIIVGCSRSSSTLSLIAILLQISLVAVVLYY